MLKESDSVTVFVRMLLQDFFVFLGLLHFTNAGKTLTHCDSTCGIAPEPVEKRLVFCPFKISLGSDLLSPFYYSVSMMV